MTSGFFITGTDTGVGKTLISCALLHALREQGISAVGMKPVASGSEQLPEGLRNADALQLQTASSVQLPYAIVNPYAFAPAIAPHLAAQLAGMPIEIERIAAAYRECAAQTQAVIVEGAGGWRLPLGDGRFLSDFAEQQQLDVVLVVGLRLGCLNHARLTAEVIERGPCKLVGWVGNQVEPGMALLAENVATLDALLAAPCLGIVPHLPAADARQATAALNVSPLIARLSPQKVL